MVQAHELRIGNWLWYDDDMYADRLNKIRDNWFQVAYAGETIGLDIGFDATQRFEKNPIWSPKIEELKPIPLTPEIVGKIGKEWAGSIDLGHNCWYDLKTKEFGIYGQEHSVTLVEDVKYLHQLQNLFFALTGTELEVKL